MVCVLSATLGDINGKVHVSLQLTRDMLRLEGYRTLQLCHCVMRLTARVWTSPKLSVKTRMTVYNAGVISTLLYGSETWTTTTYAGQERRLNSFHLRSIRRILGISWQDKVTNADVLSRAGLPTMFTLLRQRRLRWLGHVRRMEDGRIPKDILYGELALGGEPLAALTCDIKMSAQEI